MTSINKIYKWDIIASLANIYQFNVYDTKEEKQSFGMLGFWEGVYFFVCVFFFF